MKTNVVLFSVLSVLMPAPLALAADDAEMIKSAESAAPAAVASNATILVADADMKIRTLREGTNGWWCMPDDPGTVDADPMCGDANAMEWAQAWMTKTEPPKGKVGLIYMIAGPSGASNTDPYAMTETADNNWVMTGPHVMIMNAAEMMAGYPTDAMPPNPTSPYVMYPGTPYAHLMVPVN